jgi:hypothetical protein
MNKLIVAALAVLALLLLGVPRVLGSITEARVRERVAAIDASGIVSADVTSYDRGWFGSTAKIALGLAPQYLPRRPRATPFAAVRRSPSTSLMDP